MLGQVTLQLQNRSVHDGKMTVRAKLQFGAPVPSDFLRSISDENGTLVLANENFRSLPGNREYILVFTTSVRPSQRVCSVSAVIGYGTQEDGRVGRISIAMHITVPGRVVCRC